MLEQLSQLPGWIYRLAWSCIAVLSSYLVGQLVNRTVCRRLSVWAAKTRWKWDGEAVDALQRGIPIWSVLFGLHVAVGLWQLPPQLFETVSRVLYVLAWLSATIIAANLTARLVVLYGSHFAGAVPVTSLTEHLAKIAVVILGALMILNGMGVSITPLLTALGVGGLAVALALQETLSNLFSGFYVAMARHIRVGDYIKLESGEEGYVDDIGWRATKIRMLPNNMVLVPNNKLGNAIITNYYLPSKELAVLVEVGVDYGSDLAHVERVTCEVAKDTMRTAPGGVPEFEPFIRYHTFADYSINFTVILRAKEFTDQYLVKHEFIKRLHVRYQQEGITIPFPIQTVRTVSADAD